MTAVVTIESTSQRYDFRLRFVVEMAEIYFIFSCVKIIRSELPVVAYDCAPSPESAVCPPYTRKNTFNATHIAIEINIGIRWSLNLNQTRAYSYLNG